MLQITDICKEYRTGTLVQRALDGVSLSLRDNEFVAILGQSGSGKTTLLNIIGGLDRYDSGELVINGVSTKKYTDRDWDSYRNHTVGFVFQSYNLIPHQTILRNVELALTIGGISSADRTARATEALTKVGLSEHIHKKPSQLSGGQMQRVAIARALVNDPDILLADEPTGALDSETSIQVMDLLKEVAEDRLVVMVTHNPELAEQYATRIVTLKDGRITSDSDPYTPAPTDAVHRNLGKASMSFLTALALSFNNLWTKKTRTILVAFAGSIGIIGIAMILAMSTGANQYIRSVEEDSLQDYPLTINDTNVSLLSLFTEAASGMDDDAEKAEKKDVEEWRAVTSFFSGISANDLKSFKAYLESDECDVYDHVQALEYSYNLTPQIFIVDDEDSYRQVNPDRTFSSLGFSGTDSLSGLFSSMSSTDSFSALPRDKDLLHSTYELKAGSWPQSYNECVIILSPSGRVTDMTLYILGLKDPDELARMTQAFLEGRAEELEDTQNSYSYDELMGAEFRVVPASSYYTYDSKYKVWAEHSSDKKYMTNLLKDAETMRVVGIVQPQKNANTTGMNVGFGYTADLIDRLIDLSAESAIVKAQMQNPEIDVITGEPFGEESDKSGLDLSKLFSVDSKAIEDAFSGMNTSGLDLSSLDLSSVDFSNVDLSDALKGMDMTKLFPSLSPEDIEELLSGIRIDVTAEDMTALFEDILNGYADYAADDPRADIRALPEALAEYLGTDAARSLIRSKIQAIITEKLNNVITPELFTSVLEDLVNAYPNYLKENGLSDANPVTGLSSYFRSGAARATIDESVRKLRDQLAGVITLDDVTALTSAIIADFEQYANEKALPSGGYMLQSFSEYMKTPAAKKLLSSAATKAIDASSVENAMAAYSKKMSAQLEGVMKTIMNAVASRISDALSGAMGTLMGGLSDNIMSAFNFDTDTLSELFKMNMSADELKDLMVSLMTVTESSYESNLKKLGYVDRAKPSMITIYPRDYDSKNHIKDIITAYNRRVTAAGEEDKVIRYTDVVDALMGSVTTIIDVISYVLIAFVAVSLIVSSIMIGVITYISVLERKKEIGILRAIGASKRNISQVFNAETFIIGALAGLIGVGLTALMIIPANMLIHSLSGVYNINAYLPPLSAVILVLLSIVLTLIGGLIPSRKAAASDPVTALRSE
jgi:ABC-type lipoprotein export system ATPase subunit